MSTEKTPEEIADKYYEIWSEKSSFKFSIKKAMINAMKEYAAQFQPKAISEEEIIKMSAEYGLIEHEDHGNTTVSRTLGYMDGFKAALSFSLPHKEEREYSKLTNDELDQLWNDITGELEKLNKEVKLRKGSFRLPNKTNQ